MNQICKSEMEKLKQWKMIMTPDEIQFCVKKCADIINKRFANDKIIVVGILKGCVYFFTDLTKQLILPQSWYFIDASSYYNSQTQSDKVTIIGSIEPSKFVDRQVVLIDELFDSGKTLNDIKRAIMEKAAVPPERIYTCTLFKKNIITKYPEPDLYGISVPNIWLVGYGLDDCQEKRNWTYLYGVPKESGSVETDDDIIFKNNIAYEKIRSKITDQMR